MVREAGPQLMLHGTLGSYVKYGSDPQEVQLKAGLRPGMEGWGMEDSTLAGILHTEIDGKIVRKPIVSERSCYEHYYDNIFKAIRHQTPLFVPAEQALLTIRIIELAEKSHAEKRTVLSDVGIRY
jgi:predicted dehydrogenase